MPSAMAGCAVTVPVWLPDTGFTLLDRHDQGDLVRILRDRLEIKASPGQFPRRETLVEIFSALVNKDFALDTLMNRGLSAIC